MTANESKNTQKIRILEWNINLRAKDTLFVPDYFVEEIIRRKPDVIVLLEFNNQENVQSLKNQLSDYLCYSYLGDETGKLENQKNYGNGIFIGLKKTKFNNRNNDEYEHQGIEAKEPNWLHVHAILNNGNVLDITGVRVQVGKGTGSKEFRNRVSQIKWLLDKQKSFGKQKPFEKQIIVGDFNYGPHISYWAENLALNWQNVVYLFHDKGYKNSNFNQYGPFSPTGTSWKSEKLDWLAAKNVKINQSSDYNKLDWSFAKAYDDTYYVPGFRVPEGYFVRTDVGYPDHAIFTVEIEV